MINIKYLIFPFLLTLSLAVLYPAPQAELWDYWNSSNETEAKTIDHGAFQSFLDAYRKGEESLEAARVDYASVSEQDRQLLIEYTRGLARLNILEYSRAEQFAYWVNLYNALTISMILENYPLKSIRKISKPWDRTLISINGLDLSLNDIEHRILRPQWKEPRIHFVVNCASIGCPDLPNRVLTARNSEEILAESTRAYINNRRGIALEGGKLQLSSIFDWYAEDFGKDKRALVDFLSLYYDFDKLEESTGKSPYDLRWKYRYHWDLNDYRLE